MRAFIKITLVLVLINLVVVWATANGYLEPYPNLRRWFTMDLEQNIPAWFSSSLMLLAAALLAICGHMARRTRTGYARHWNALALLFVFLSIDEAASLHESLLDPVQQAFNLGGPLLFAWVVPGLALVILVALASVPLLAHLPSATRWRILGAGGLYVMGALGMEMVGGWYWEIHQRPRLIYMGLTTLEEMLEIAGLIAFIHALLFHLRSFNPRLQIALAE